MNEEELLIEQNRVLEDANAELVEKVEKLEKENERLNADYQKLLELAKDQTEFLEWLDDTGLINDGWWDTNKAKEKYDLWKKELK